MDIVRETFKLDVILAFRSNALVSLGQNPVNLEVNASMFTGFRSFHVHDRENPRFLKNSSYK